MHYQVIKWEFRGYEDFTHIGWVPALINSFSDKGLALSCKLKFEQEYAETRPTFEWHVGITENAEDESYKYARS